MGREDAVQQLLNTEVRWRHGNTRNPEAIGAMIDAAGAVRGYVSEAEIDRGAQEAELALFMAGNLEG